MDAKHFLTLIATTMTLSGCATESPKNVAYLFTYFSGNAPEEEQICYALSDDGYNYTPLNGGRPVIASECIAMTGCVRDPHILRAEDGKTFYMVATDMKSSLGWTSNRGLVMLRSTDLVNWEHHAVHFPTRFTDAWANVIRVWAPETVYDPATDRYIVFYSLLTSDEGSHDCIYYSVANDDFSDISEPALLFDTGRATIDGDIVFNPADSLFHLFYKSEAGKGIYQATTADITSGDWNLIPDSVEQTSESVEGVGVCRSIDGQSWIVMYDCYMDGHYQFCKSDDLRTFVKVQDTPTTGNFTPRHGTIIPITQEEKVLLLNSFGY